MKLNPDCIRDILITVESMEYNTAYTLTKLCTQLPSYSEEELNYHCLQLIDAGLLNAKAINVMGQISPQLWRIFDLTYPGHQFLADVRSDTTWNKTKNISSTPAPSRMVSSGTKNCATVTTTVRGRSSF